LIHTEIGDGNGTRSKNYGDPEQRGNRNPDTC
jgi:hypothetical protein